MKIFCFIGWHTWRHKDFHKDPNYQLVKCKYCDKEEKRYSVFTWVTK